MAQPLLIGGPLVWAGGRLSERYSFDPRRKVVLRHVRRRAGGTTSSVVARCGSTSGIPDSDLADALYLRSEARPPRTRSTSELRVADLFSGCGAMSLGIEEACRALGIKFVVAAAIDKNIAPLEVYARNFESRACLDVDLGTTLWHELSALPRAAERRMMHQIGKVDMVVAGPPCQGHSNLNNSTRRRDSRNDLYFTVARFAQLFRPTYVMIENVIAVVHDKGKVVQRTWQALQSLGYEVTDGIVDLWKIGVPQTRRRHILLGILRRGRSRVDSPLPTLREMVERHLTPERSVMWAIDDLAGARPSDALHRAAESKDVTRQRIDFLFEQGHYELPDSERPDCHRNRRHTYGSVYGRMYPERPAPTITGGFDTMGRGRFVHPTERRTITPREAARIQFIPDFFDFTPAVGTRRELVEMVGNAVPPKLSYVMALELLR